MCGFFTTASTEAWYTVSAAVHIFGDVDLPLRPAVICLGAYLLAARADNFTVFARLAMLAPQHTLGQSGRSVAQAMGEVLKAPVVFVRAELSLGLIRRPSFASQQDTPEMPAYFAEAINLTSRLLRGQETCPLGVAIG